MTRWYPLEPTDASFLDSAPHVFRYRKRHAAPPERVWESLASDASIAVKKVLTTSHGTGWGAPGFTTRVIRCWEPLSSPKFPLFC